MPLDPDKSRLTTTATAEVDFDTLVALLGGGNAADVLAKGVAGREDLVRALDDPRAWLTPGTRSKDPSAASIRQLALEVTAIKLRVFERICRRLADSGRGELAMADIGGRLQCQPGSLIPARWCVEVSMIAGDETGAGGEPEDVRRTLGRILARLLFANDQRAPADAEALATKLADQFAEGLDRAPGTPDEWARNLFGRSEVADSSTLLHRADLRERTAAGLPRGVWRDLGALTLGLLGQAGPLAFCDSAPTEAIAKIYAHVTTLLQRIDVEAFGAAARSDEVLDVLQAALATRSTD